MGECKRTTCEKPWRRAYTCEKLWRRTSLQKRPSSADHGGWSSCSIRREQQPECPSKNIRCKHPVKEEDIVPARVLHVWISATSSLYHQPCELLHWSTGHMYLARKNMQIERKKKKKTQEHIFTWFDQSDYIYE